MWRLVASAIALVLLFLVAGAVVLKLGFFAPPKTSATIPYATLAQIAQVNAEWLNPASPFSQRAQQLLQEISDHGDHAGQSLTFDRSYDYVIADTDGYPHAHEGYYVTIGVFTSGGHTYVTVGAVTASHERTPLTFSLANLDQLQYIQQNRQGTYPSFTDRARIAPADLLTFLGVPGHLVGLDLVASAFTPNVAPIISALQGTRTTQGLTPFQLPAAGQPLDPANYPNPTAVYTFPPYSTPPASALATATGQTAAPTATALPASTPLAPPSVAATLAMNTLNFTGATSVTIKAGQAVRFDDPATGGGFHNLVTGAHGAYTAQFGAPSQFTPNGILFNPGTSSVIVFPTPGSFSITCTLHPYMVATVTVTP
jgi:plastocyanin